ncbi:MAG: PIG-L family deacetylase [Phenylobacterium sp.]|uniref:PIG-L deacetylase family protein n=1 Tax=Phenylobacterium sp. TaxID=1871053 RepID=UPI001A5877EE|nr:PIG-L family deacetylase [Phenylobacterium sp.]MBL8772090.1 PIG-L family deacetylase [Phenylobacterium sp.]
MARILAVHAHPDDIEMLAAGALALLARSGHHVTLVTATAGDCGSAEHEPQETARIRMAEAAEAAALIGADYRCLGLPDLGVFSDDPTRRRVTELLREVRPDVVIASSPVDYHPDHEAIGLLVRDACFAAPVPNYRTGDAAPLEGIPHLYLCDPIGGHDRTGGRVDPEFGADVAAAFETKRAMLACHRSQAAWVAKQHGIDDHGASMEAWTRRQGRLFGVELAEGFRQYRHQPYPTTPRLQELLGGALLAARPAGGAA